MDLGENVHTLVKGFPEQEKFNLNSQLMRAVDSVALNISEGSIGQSNPEFKRFVGYAIRSLAETVTCIYKAEKRNYITKEEFKAVYKESFELMNMLTALKKTLN